MNRKIMVKIMIVLILALSAGIFTSKGIESKTQAISAAPTSITIDGNADFDTKSITYGWSGDGTKNNPYIIENYIFSMTGAPGVNISNTDRYFILRNVKVTGSTNYGAGGIHFYKVTNGQLENNNVTGSDMGIYIFVSDNNILTNNTANSNQLGIFIFGSDNNILTNNTANGVGSSVYGIWLLGSDNNILTNNTVSGNNKYGIKLYNSDNNILTNNTASGNNKYGIYLNSSSNFNILTQNTAINNWNIGIFIAYSSNNILTQNTASNNFEDGIYLRYSSNNTLIQNTANSNPAMGISLSYSSNSTLTQNTANNNKYSGIYLTSSSNYNTLTNNSANNNNWSGIYLQNSNNNSFTQNSLSSNNGHGIWIDGTSSDNTISRNRFINNNLVGSSQALDSGIDNVFYLNYWNDWTSPDNNVDLIVDIPYSIHGTPNNKDYFPHVLASILTISLNNPLNGSILQSGTRIDLSVLGSNGTLIYAWDNIPDKTVSITFDPILPTGDRVHFLDLFAQDNAGNWIYKQFMFITDDTPPTINLISPINGTTQNSGTKIDIAFGNSSEDPLVKTTEYSYNWDGTANFTVSVNIKPVIPSSPGIHKLHVYAIDESGNIAYSYYEFIVQDPSQTSSQPKSSESTPSTTPTSSEPTPSTTPGFELIVLIGSFITINIIKKRKRKNF